MALLNIHQGICVNNKYYKVKFPHLQCSGVDSVEAGAVSPGLDSGHQSRRDQGWTNHTQPATGKYSKIYPEIFQGGTEASKN